MKKYLLKNCKTGLYTIYSTPKCMDKYVKSQTARVSFGRDFYYVIQEIEDLYTSKFNYVENGNFPRNQPVDW